ncbi:MAG: pentapeptide repeat-containing protein [Anaerolineae bacterium]
MANVDMHGANLRQADLRGANERREFKWGGSRPG